MNRRNKSNVIFVVVLTVFAVISCVFAFVYISGGEKKDEMPEIKQESIPVEKETDDDFSALAVAKVLQPALDIPTSFPDISRVSFVAVGDNIVHSSVMSDSVTLAEGTEKEYNFVPMFENVESYIKQADFAFINQEAPIAGKARGYAGYPMFNSPEQVVYDLAEVGFDIFNIANNHMLDRHTSGYESTVNFFKESGYTYLGGFTDKEEGFNYSKPNQLMKMHIVN